jgi:hypothetical protein
LNFPITSITSNWDVYFDEEMKQTNYYEQSSSTAPTYDTDKITVPKIQDISIDTPYAPSYQEFQFLKPSSQAY